MLWYQFNTYLNCRSSEGILDDLSDVESENEDDDKKEEEKEDVKKKRQEKSVSFRAMKREIGNLEMRF